MPDDSSGETYTNVTASGALHGEEHSSGTSSWNAEDPPRRDHHDPPQSNHDGGQQHVDLSRDTVSYLDSVAEHLRDTWELDSQTGQTTYGTSTSSTLQSPQYTLMVAILCQSRQACHGKPLPKHRSRVRPASCTRQHLHRIRLRSHEQSPVTSLRITVDNGWSRLARHCPHTAQSRELHTMLPQLSTLSLTILPLPLGSLCFRETLRGSSAIYRRLGHRRCSRRPTSQQFSGRCRLVRPIICCVGIGLSI